MSNYNPDDQRIFFDGLDNSRDLGGMPLKDGHTFKRNVFLRTDSLSDLTTLQVDALINYGVKCVIDLRSDEEISNYGNPMINRPEVNFHPCSLFVGDPDSLENETMVFLKTHFLGDFYITLLQKLPHKIVEILRILKDEPAIGLFHCAHGKDRTGVIAAILYLIAGASREDIITNYKVSYEYKYDFLHALELTKPDDLKHTMRSDKINMEIFLDYIDRTYSGDIKNFLTQNGMSEEEIDELKNKCIE
ncbi:MAG: tyrosine-protein phosphatase [Clostridia bacterium]|nr:tyrosine-protein phosphatase [Clostridia bacterium]